jgi:predicted lipid-binding transport protein (Tim44 family)
MKQKSLLIEGLSDAIGFLGGALFGYGIGLLAGLDIMGAGYGNATIFGIVLVGLGGGFGLQLARTWRKNRQTKADQNQDSNKV